MRIDAHCHIGESLFRVSRSAEELIKDMDISGIDRAVISPLKPPSYHYGPSNDIIFSIVKKYPDRFIGMARVDPWQNDAAAEFERCIEKLGLNGLFLHPWEENFPVTFFHLLSPIMDIAQKKSIPVMIAGGHVRVSHPAQLDALARHYPKVSFIMTSGGQINISGGLLRDAKLMLQNNTNVFMETSGIYREDFIEEMIKSLGSKRVIFGSGYPQYNMGFEFLRIERAKISDNERRDVSGENVKKLIGI